jgi:hypothetical protein
MTIRTLDPARQVHEHGRPGVIWMANYSSNLPMFQNAASDSAGQCIRANQGDVPLVDDHGIAQAKMILNDVMEECEEGHCIRPAHLVGMMVEVPAAAWRHCEVSFFRSAPTI